jgi:hypothetical protein
MRRQWGAKTSMLLIMTWAFDVESGDDAALCAMSAMNTRHADVHNGCHIISPVNVNTRD